MGTFFSWIHRQNGQTLLELLIALALLSLILPALLTGLIASRQGKQQQRQRLLATELLQQTQDAVRSMRDSAWDFIQTNGTYHLSIVNGSWTLVSGEETIGDYTESIVIDDVYRDATGAIVTTGGNIDPGTKAVNTTIRWGWPIPSTLHSLIYLTRYDQNTSFTHGDEDFTAGSTDNTVVLDTSVQLQKNASNDWCSATVTDTQLDLSAYAAPLAVAASANTLQVGTTNTFVNIAKSTPLDISVAGTVSGMRVNATYTSGDYTYLATGATGKAVSIIDTTENPYTEVGYFDSGSTSQARAVAQHASAGYLLQGDTLYSFDLTSKTGARPKLDPQGVHLAGAGTAITIVGNYAYVAIAGSTAEMQLIDISNPSSLQIRGQIDLNGQAGIAVAVNTEGTRAYVLTTSSASQKELYVVDTSQKNGNLPLLGSYDTNTTNPSSLALADATHLIIVGTGGQGYQVVDIADEQHLRNCGGLETINGKGVVTAVAQDEKVYSYVLRDAPSAQLRVVSGGNVDAYVASGVYESEVFHASSSAMFNRFTPQASTPAHTSVSYQIAVALANQSGSCEGVRYTFIGPDGTDETTFATGSAIPLQSQGTGYRNPGQCFKYKVFLATSDPSQTPEFFGMSVNYSQ